jgi:hypothetical protein
MITAKKYFSKGLKMSKSDWMKGLRDAEIYIKNFSVKTAKLLLDSTRFKDSHSAEYQQGFYNSIKHYQEINDASRK